MRPSLFALAALLVLAGCSSVLPTGTGSGSGVGVVTTIANAPSITDAYFTLNSKPGQTLPQQLQSLGQGDPVHLFDMNLVVHDEGYADSLTALYISGYDPSLFAVVPLGPYLAQSKTRYCYRDVTLESDSTWSANVLCEAGDQVYLGGGYTSGSNGGFSVSAYNANVAKYLDSLVSLIKGGQTSVFEKYGLFQNMSVTCSAPTSGSSQYQKGCRISSPLGAFYYNRASQGALALALYGDSVRNCQNGCILVPSPRLPDQFLSGNTAQYPGGEAANVDLGVYMDRSRWPANLNDHQQLFQVTACSLYTTYATPTVCIDPNPATSDGEVCRPGILKMQSQPAPVSITSIDEVNQGPRVMFTIHVKNEGSGTVFDPGSIDYCAPSAPDSMASQRRNEAKIVDARVLGSLKAMDCRDGIIHFVNGQGQVTCFYDLPPESIGRPAYQTTVSFEIAYIYRNIQTVETTIHRT